MAEKISKETRSRIMSKIRSKNTKPELILKKLLKGTHLRQHPNIEGKPDFGSKSKKIAIFIDGCYWHGCPKCGHIPKTRTEFWKAKIERNITRDNSNRAKLRKIGIKPLRFWEHQLKKKEDLKKVINKITKALQGTKNER